MMEKDIKKSKEEENCIFYCYKGYCNRNYYKEKKAFGWASVIEYRCKKKCYLFRKRNLWNKIIAWLFFR